jgi:hypothetical protein
MELPGLEPVSGPRGDSLAFEGTRATTAARSASVMIAAAVIVTRSRAILGTRARRSPSTIGCLMSGNEQESKRGFLELQQRRSHTALTHTRSSTPSPGRHVIPTFRPRGASAPAVVSRESTAPAPRLHVLRAYLSALHLVARDVDVPNHAADLGMAEQPPRADEVAASVMPSGKRWRPGKPQRPSPEARGRQLAGLLLLGCSQCVPVQVLIASGLVSAQITHTASAIPTIDHSG